MVKILFTSVLKFWFFGAFSSHWVDFVSNCAVGLFLGTKLAQIPLRPRWSQQKKRSLNSVPDLAASPAHPSPRVHKTIPYCNRKQHPPVSHLSSKWPTFCFWLQYAYFWLSPSGKQRRILALGPNLCNRIWVHATSGLWKTSLSSCQSGWREIPLIRWVRLGSRTKIWALSRRRY